MRETEFGLSAKFKLFKDFSSYRQSTSFEQSSSSFNLAVQAKGQIMVLLSLVSSKKTNKRIGLYYCDTSSRLVFIRFLQEIKDTEKCFEII